MVFTEIEPEQVPMALLLEADPSVCSVQRYLNKSWCFATIENQCVIGVCLICPLSHTTVELANIAVLPALQSKGIGAQLLRFTLKTLKSRGIVTVELGTGTFGHQLAFYQRQGFRVESVVKNYFLEHYQDPIFENGIQHKDRLQLTCDLRHFE